MKDGPDNQAGMGRRTVLAAAAAAVPAAIGLPAAIVVPALGTTAAAAATASPGRAIRAYEIGPGSPDDALGLRLVTRPAPQPGPGEVVMRVRATGLIARDSALMRGSYSGGRVPTRIPLSDNAGEVLTLGAGVEQVAVGDRVTLTHFSRWLDGPWDSALMQYDRSVNVDGFLCEQAVVPAASLVRIPGSLSFVQASTLQSAGLTAWRALVVEGGVKAGDVVLTLGTGGVSLFNLQLAKAQGATVIVTSSSDEKLARMKALGADFGINYRRTPAWAREVLALTGEHGADIVLNTVGYAEMERCLMACANNARLVHIGSGKAQAPFDALPNLMVRNVSLKGITVGSRRMFEDLVKAVVANRISPVIDRVFPFEQAVEAVRFFESGERLGKVVIEVG
jgi:NADPH:quinone reductase-like Zn-dependent oxidoreductase